MQIPLDMTFPLWGLVIFISWIITVVIWLLIVRIRHLSIGGSIKDFATQNDGSLLWRLFRVQANLVENLPLYLGVVLLLTLRGVSGTTVNLLTVVYIISRLAHSAIHIAGLDPRLRASSLMVQFGCLLSLIGLAIL